MRNKKTPVEASVSPSIATQRIIPENCLRVHLPRPHNLRALAGGHVVLIGREHHLHAVHQRR